jgi:hypothetical protein
MKLIDVTVTTAEGTTHECGAQLYESLDAAFDTHVAPNVTRLVLEELGPGEDMVPILDRVEVANGDA